MMLALLLLLAQQAAPPSPPAAAVPAAPEPYAGAPREGLAALAGLVEAGEDARALELARSLAAPEVLTQLAGADRARLLHDVGLACARAGDTEAAVGDLRAAAALAGPGALRAHSLYAAGTARLLEAERLRRDVPEIAQRLGLPSSTPQLGPPTPREGPDALEIARTAYAAAREELLARLRLDWRDEDTRANLELVVRRLRELDEIERQREEQQQEQQQQQQQKDPQDQDQQQQPQDDQQQEPQQQDPEQQEQEQDQQQDEEQPGEEEQGEEEQGEEGPQEPEEGQPEPVREEERVLSREEVLRLLEQLAAIEEQARAVRAMLRERKRRPVEKDW